MKIGETGNGGPPGISAGGDVYIGDVSGQVAIGQDIKQLQFIGRADLEELKKSLLDFQEGIAKLGLSPEDESIIKGDTIAAIKEAMKDSPKLSIIIGRFENAINTAEEAGGKIKDIPELYKPAKKIAELAGIPLSFLWLEDIK